MTSQQCPRSRTSASRWCGRSCRKIIWGTVYTDNQHRKGGSGESTTDRTKSVLSISCGPNMWIQVECSPWWTLCGMCNPGMMCILTCFVQSMTMNMVCCVQPMCILICVGYPMTMWMYYVQPMTIWICSGDHDNVDIICAAQEHIEGYVQTTTMIRCCMQTDNTIRGIVYKQKNVSWSSGTDDDSMLHMGHTYMYWWCEQCSPITKQCTCAYFGPLSLVGCDDINTDVWVTVVVHLDQTVREWMWTRFKARFMVVKRTTKPPAGRFSFWSTDQPVIMCGVLVSKF